MYPFDFGYKMAEGEHIINRCRISLVHHGATLKTNWKYVGRIAFIARTREDVTAKSNIGTLSI